METDVGSQVTRFTDNCNDIHLGYTGGSGGFILLHLLLASGKFFVAFDNDIDFDEAIKEQWRIRDPATWKLTEKWPSRHRTIWAGSSQQRIYFFCNPTLEEYFNPTQTPLVEAYDSVKDISWPDIDGILSYNQLPQQIKQECEIQHGLLPVVQCFSRPKIFLWIYTDIHSQNELCFYKKAGWYHQKPNMEKTTPCNVSIYNNDPVDARAAPFLERCHITLRLQDVINEPNVLIDTKLISSVNDLQISLIQQWKSLHTPELLEKIGVYFP